MPEPQTTPEILSDGALTETEARLSRSVELDLLPDVRALCQTVRALKTELGENARRHFDDARSLEQERNEALDQCTELRRRLAQVEKGRSELQTQVQGLRDELDGIRAAYNA